MADNKMSDVAALLGKKLGESFYIKHPKLKEPTMVKIKENGLWYAYFRDNEITWFDEDIILIWLLKGEAEIISDEEAFWLLDR